MYLMSLLTMVSCTTESLKETAEEILEVPEEIDDLSWVNPENLPAGDNPCRSPVRVLVETVFDGDTFVAQSEEGQETVRIIGVDTPETSSGQCYAAEAKSFLIQQIFGRHVWLTFDGECTDFYDRTLAYVHLGTNEQDFVERQLLLGGYAKAFPFDDTDTFELVFAQDEYTASTNGSGGWSVCDW